MAPAGIIRGGNELYVLFAKRRELRHILNRIVDVKPRRKESGKMADWKENKAVGIAAAAVRATRAARAKERALIRACTEELPEDSRAAVERRARDYHRQARGARVTAGPSPRSPSSSPTPPGGAGTSDGAAG